MMGKYPRNLERLARLDTNDKDKYCWASLESIAWAHKGDERLDADAAETYKDGARHVQPCIKEGKEIGRCWCGKFQSGEDKEDGS